MKVFVISSSQLGAREEHTANAIQLMHGPRVHHYWDGARHVGIAVQELINDLHDPAWDLWMLFGPDVTWNESAPEPSWWEHQLPMLDENHSDRRLDARRFARKALEIRGQASGKRRWEE